MIELVKVFAASRIAAAPFLDFREYPRNKDYWVSNRGHVISIKRVRPKLQTMMVSEDGYHRAWIGARREKLMPVQVSRMVLESFVCLSPADGMQCRHKNGVRWDNRPENLEWGTAKDNAADRVRHGTSPVGVRHPRAKLTEIQVDEIFNSRESDRVLAKRYGISKGNVWFIRTKRTWGHLK